MMLRSDGASGWGLKFVCMDIYGMKCCFNYNKTSIGLCVWYMTPTYLKPPHDFLQDLLASETAMLKTVHLGREMFS